MAIRLAYEHPAEAEEVLNRLHEPFWYFTGQRIESAGGWRRIQCASARGLPPGCLTRRNARYAWAFLADGLAAADPEAQER